jgi:hypothetical protein
MPNADKSGAGQGSVNFDVDRYPTLASVLRAIKGDEDLPDGPIERLEIYANASGDASTRVWTPRAEEPVIGYYAESELG